MGSEPGYTPIGATYYIFDSAARPEPFSKAQEGDIEVDDLSPVNNVDTEFGRHQARLELEVQLLRKVDKRMVMLVVIYVLNYVRHLQLKFNRAVLTVLQRCTDRPQRRCVSVNRHAGWI